jgi:hypothetical protein
MFTVLASKCQSLEGQKQYTEQEYKDAVLVRSAGAGWLFTPGFSLPYFWSRWSC